MQMAVAGYSIFYTWIPIILNACCKWRQEELLLSCSIIKILMKLHYKWYVCHKLCSEVFVLIEWKDFHIFKCAYISNCSHIEGSYSYPLQCVLNQSMYSMCFIFEVCSSTHGVCIISTCKLLSHVTDRQRISKHFWDYRTLIVIHGG
jgi:hypothetical protein